MLRDTSTLLKSIDWKAPEANTLTVPSLMISQVPIPLKPPPILLAIFVLPFSLDSWLKLWEIALAETVRLCLYVSQYYSCIYHPRHVKCYIRLRPLPRIYSPWSIFLLTATTWSLSQSSYEPVFYSNLKHSLASCREDPWVSTVNTRD